MRDAAFWISQLGMSPHPEGGYFAETYRAAERIAGEALPPRFGAERSLGTAIYFLLESHHRSAFHRIQSDEIWHFYAGASVQIFYIQDDQLHTIHLGNDPSQGQVFQAIVPAGCWFGALPSTSAEGYSLVGCTVAPGFDFADFELADMPQLIAQYPHYESIVHELSAHVS
jgi:uncharacterized protein